MSIKSSVRKIVRFLTLQNGPTAVEYAFLLLLIVLVCLKAIDMIGQSTNQTLENSGDEISTAIEGGGDAGGETDEGSGSGETDADSGESGGGDTNNKRGRPVPKPTTPRRSRG